MCMKVAVLGAGMVGVSCAWALQRRGHDVVLLDRREPGSETSHGNAGVLSPTSLLPFNHPGLWRQLPQLLMGKNPGFRARAGYLLSHGSALAAFLAHARPSVFPVTTTALHGLISYSRGLHAQWLPAAGQAHRWRQDGWLFLYRNVQAWQAAQWARQLYQAHGLQFETLDAQALTTLEPALKQGFTHALWVQGAASVDGPGEVVQALARTVTERGGHFVCDEVRQLQLGTSRGTGWTVHLAQASALEVDRVVLALGPWSRDFLAAQWGWRLPMIHERGYHMHYSWDGPRLGRPVYDTSGAYVLSPMGPGVRMTTGVELDHPHSAPRPSMWQAAEQAARQNLPLGLRLDESAWLGSRPTLPDSRPMIGAAPALPDVWLALGHQHIGFSTGPGSGELLASLMSEEVPPIDPTPFSPLRFGTRWIR